MKGILRDRAAGDGETEAGVGQRVATEEFERGVGQDFVFVLEGDEEGFAASAEAGEVVIDAEDFGSVAAHGGEDSSTMQQTRVADGNVGGAFVDELSVDPDLGHGGMVSMGMTNDEMRMTNEIRMTEIRMTKFQGSGRFNG